jgi:plasmid stability protein
LTTRSRGRLEARAEAAGRSVEAEHRVILEAVLKPRRTGADLLRQMRANSPLLTAEEVEVINQGYDQPHEPVKFPE